MRELVDEGRTVFLSSHLLDEVEKVCDAAAIVDGGRVLMQGTISEIATDGNLMVDVECSDHDAAVRALGGLPVLTAITRTADGLRLTVAGDDRRRCRRHPRAGRGRHRRLPDQPGSADARGALPRADHYPRSGGMSRRMIAAEVLKLVRRRGQMVVALMLTVGAVAAGYAITWGYHLSDAVRCRPGRRQP